MHIGRIGRQGETRMEWLRAGARACGAALVAVALIAVLLCGIWTGEPAADVAPVEERIQEAVRRVDRAATAVAAARAAQRMAAAFQVSPRMIADLHDQKLDFGEVAVVLALAEAGRTSSDQILGLWASARLDWGQIAARLRVDVLTLLERLERIRRDLMSPAAARPTR
jgi:hypothetical protein